MNVKSEVKFWLQQQHTDNPDTYFTTAEIALPCNLSVYQARYYLLGLASEGCVEKKEFGKGKPILWRLTPAG
ncbi:FaeA/PapI family transcriptional regulator [Enterobacillus tribolii]|uniref:FaeA-like protein n=1 Tax=Enterobacillus tribolii TaxID=1487935 RepID=A0A370R303_9GAMM|nr:FaeA/PapI family transcriptional regulator [Enterobacillus tribolii]MBW7983870.1 regulator [Enterobacillus tribolii]RDK96806.1 FaeA-like protein [Enterobacillus tribolii]